MSHQSTSFGLLGRVTGALLAALLAVAGLAVVESQVAGAALPVPERVSVNTAGAGAADGVSAFGGFDASGQIVAFYSSASNLVASDTNDLFDVFVRDRGAGTTERVSVSSAGVEANSASFLSDAPGRSVSADGRYVVFASFASNLVTGDTNDTYDVFVRDRVLGTTTRLSVAPGGIQSNGVSADPAISADGRYVAFQSGATNLVPGDTNDIFDLFVVDRTTGAVTRENVKIDGSQTLGEAFQPEPALSADGRYLAFDSLFNIEDDGATSGPFLYLRDRVAGTTTLIATDVDMNKSPSISDDGRYIAYAGAGVDIYDRVTATSTTVAGGRYPSISGDGRYVAYSTEAPYASGDTNGYSDIYVQRIGTENRVWTSAGPGGVPGNDNSWYPALDHDGGLVLFASLATNLTANDTNGNFDTFVSATAESDLNDPSVSIASPPPGATYEFGQQPVADYSCDDVGGSGLASCVGTVPDGSAISMTLGSHSFTVTATDNAGNTTTITRNYTVVSVHDNLPPTIVASSPVDGTTYAPNQVVNATYSCADESGGSGLASCVGLVPSGSPIDTSTPGTEVFHVTATDAAGNQAQLTRRYTVGGPGPLVAISSPGSSSQYAVGQVVAAAYSCSPGVDGTAVATCEGPVANGDSIPTTFGLHSFSVTGTDVLGRETTETISYHVYALATASENLPPTGGTVVTNVVPTPAVPFGTSVTSPNGGQVSIVDQAQAGGPPTGFTALGAQVLITAPPASRDAPLILAFYGEGSALPPGINQSNIQLAKDGVVLTNCLGATVVPTGVTACISGRDPAPSGGGDIRITVISISASLWSLATPVPTIVGGTASVVEGASGTRVLSVPFTLNRAGNTAVTAHWATASGTAATGSDFVASSGTLTFLPGETRKTVNVVVKGDTAVEVDETVRVNLSSPTNASAGAAAIGTIVDDDRPGLSVNDLSVTEGNGGAKQVKFTISRAAKGPAVSVRLTTANGTARSGTDYTATSVVVTLKANKTSVDVKVPVVGDKVREPTEYFTVTLSNASSPVRIADGSGRATILDTD